MWCRNADWFIIPNNADNAKYSLHVCSSNANIICRLYHNVKMQMCMKYYYLLMFDETELIQLQIRTLTNSRFQNKKHELNYPFLITKYEHINITIKSNLGMSIYHKLQTTLSALKTAPRTRQDIPLLQGCHSPGLQAAQLFLPSESTVECWNPSPLLLFPLC